MKARIVFLYVAAAALVMTWIIVAPRLLKRSPAVTYTTPEIAPRPVPDFKLTDQHGQSITRRDLLGKVWVANFIFSACPGPCLDMTKRMGEIDHAVSPGDDVRIVTFSIDPKNDTPAALATYAERVTAGPRWLFLTGERAITAHVANDGFLFPLSTDPTNFAHSERIAVVDKTGTVRGWFDSAAKDLVPSVNALVEKLRVH